MYLIPIIYLHGATLQTMSGGGEMKCIGFGVMEGKCTNKAGTQWSDYWCDGCDKVRRDTVRKQLEDIQKHMEDEGKCQT